MDADQYNALTAKVDDIHRALVGEERYGREGLIALVARHEAWISTAKLRIAGIMGGSAVVAVILNRAWEFLTSK